MASSELLQQLARNTSQAACLTKKKSIRAIKLLLICKLCIIIETLFEKHLLIYSPSNNLLPDTCFKIKKIDIIQLL